jgi:putative nucleotidyltransferase with HDIG domain
LWKELNFFQGIGIYNEAKDISRLVEMYLGKKIFLQSDNLQKNFHFVEKISLNRFIIILPGSKANFLEELCMERVKALVELKARITNSNLIKHSLAVEAIMKEMAVLMKDDAELWGLAGLLHDIDYEKTVNHPEWHSLLGAEILEDLDIDPDIVYAVKAHNSCHGIERKRKMDKALYCADPVSGLITAGALILPSKKLADVTTGFILKRMDEKSFAKGADRDQIRSCSELGLSLEEFIETALKAMKKISDELGL